MAYIDKPILLDEQIDFIFSQGKAIHAILIALNMSEYGYQKWYLYKC